MVLLQDYVSYKALNIHFVYVEKHEYDQRPITKELPIN